jgi:hypothetical protein
MRRGITSAVCALTLLAACGNAAPQGSTSDAGADGGAVWCRFGGDPVSLQLAVHSYDAPDACGVITKNGSLLRANATHLWLQYTFFCVPNCNRGVWPLPGSYPVSISPGASTAGVEGGFTARLEPPDATCSGVAEDATGGSVTIVTVGDDVLDAAYELDFPSGPRKGPIHASSCAAPCGVIQQTKCPAN